MSDLVTVVGAGLAGCEAAWQAARRGVRVRLHEMRPVVSTAVHKTGLFAELVCSNSFKSDDPANAHGLLKEEMRRFGSLVLSAAARARVPAGAALAVDRELFARTVTGDVEAEALVEVIREEVREIPSRGPVVLATGPLVSPALYDAIGAFTGRDHLYFYDAVSPIVESESIDRDVTYPLSRYGKGSGQDYLNCPMNREEYEAFYEALLGASKVDLHEFERDRFFEGCLPLEELALRGRDTLRFGPMKPVGLKDPRTGREPHAVVQLRQDNLAAEHYSLVGFQNQLKFAEQTRIFRMIPGLSRARFVRLGMIHRNSYICAPAVLQPTFQAQSRPDLFFAGQVSGVEGYIESAASGMIAGLNAARLVEGRSVSAPPPETAIGSLCRYISAADPIDYQPVNISFGLLAPLRNPPRGRTQRRAALVRRALESFDRWLESVSASEDPAREAPEVRSREA
jgi:methylenetetrahydrofolate--tRNA-(uracil-5-)-methyltransferase